VASTLPTADVEDLANDEWCSVDKEDGVGGIPCFIYASNWVETSQGFVSFRCVHRCLYVFRSDSVHAYAFAYSKANDFVAASGINRYRHSADIFFT
jgi:hypothetical protein